MKYDLQQLVSELRRQENVAKDLVRPTIDLRAVPLLEEHTSKAIGVGLHVDNEFDGDLYPMTSWAQQQLCEQLGVPFRYFEKLLKTGRFDLAAANWNGWIQDREARTVRTLDGKVRAVLSDKYKVMDNSLVLFGMLEELKGVPAKVQRADLTETYMYVRVLFPEIAEEIRPGDAVHPGFVLSNSEVGAGALRFESFMFRTYCMNGMIGGREDTGAFEKIHLGGRRGFGTYSPETRSKESEYIYSAVRDVVRQRLNPTGFKSWVQAIREKADTPIKDPVAVVDQVAVKYNLPEDRKKAILAHFIENKDFTQWGLANAVTAHARTVGDQTEGNGDTLTELERVGGELATLDLRKAKILVEP
jgi:hypothetical protein